jgi:hypothetical protein
MATRTDFQLAATGLALETRMPALKARRVAMVAIPQTARDGLHFRVLYAIRTDAVDKVLSAVEFENAA